MKKIFFICIILTRCFSSGLCQNLEWAYSFGSTSQIEQGCSIAVDDSGNVYTTGYFCLTVDFDPGPGVFNLTATNYTDVFVSKLDNSGNLIWAKRIGGSNADDVHSINLDHSGNIYLVGNFSNTVDFDPGLGTFNLYSNPYDAFILKLDANGNFIWVKQLRSSIEITGNKIETDKLNNVYIFGNYKDTVDFNPGSLTYYLNSNGNTDVFVLKLDSLGNFIWAKSFGAMDQDNGITSAIDSLNNIYLSGWFIGTVDFDPDTGTYSIASQLGGLDSYIAKLDSSGNLIWVKTIAGNSSDQISSMTIDKFGNLCFTGYFRATPDFDPGASIYNLTSAGAHDIFVLKLDLDGDFISAKRFGSEDEDIGFSIVTDRWGDLFIGGKFTGALDFGNGNILNSSGYYDIFVLKLSSVGNLIWSGKLGGIDNEEPANIAIDFVGNLYITGSFRQTVDFDFGTGVNNLISAGYEDIFITKYNSITSINEHKKDENLVIYPNPATDIINLVAEIYSYERIVLEIYDISGRKLQTIDKGNLLKGKHYFNIDISKLSQGVYLINVSSQNKKISNKKFMKI